MPYSGDPAASDRDHVYWLLGDTDTEDQLLLDAEIDFALAQKPNVKRAAAFAARSIAAKVLQRPTHIRTDEAGSTWLSPEHMSAHYRQLAEQLEAEALAATGNYFAGGTLKSEKTAAEAQTDRDAPTFRRGLHDDRGGDVLIREDAA